jgi:hypothetical protein
MAVLREDLMEYSVLRAVKVALPEYGYILTPEPNANLEVLPAFPTPEERARELTITTLAFGFNIDDGGREAELGSTLTEYKHTLMAWVFGMENSLARQVANSIKHILRHADDGIPLLDFNQEGEPQIDTLRVEKVQVAHQGNSSNRPWDQYLWSASAVITDTFYE